MLLDDGDSRSASRVREHVSFLLVSQLHGAIQTLRSQCSLMDFALSTCLSVLIWSTSTFSSKSLSLSKRSTEPGTQLWLNDVAYKDLSVLEFVLSKPTKTPFPISFVNKPTGCSLTSLSVLDNWVFGFWLGLLEIFTTSSNFWTQFFHPLSWKEIFGGGRGDAYTFSKKISPDPITIASGIHWECVVKDDCNRSCLIELKHFCWASFRSTQYTVVWCFFHTFCLYHAKRGASKLDLCVPCSLDPQTCRIPSLFSVAQILSSRYQSSIDEGVWIDCTSDATNILEEVVRNYHIIL